jgi:hypothetical protein
MSDGGGQRLVPPALSATRHASDGSRRPAVKGREGRSATLIVRRARLLHLYDTGDGTMARTGKATACVRAGIARAATAATLLAGTPLLALGQDADPALAEAAGACDRTTAAMARACSRQAQADFFIDVANCVNLGDAGRRERCIARARRDLRATPEDCRAQQEARARVCRALGQAAYDPVIRPADFTSDITNPYFPLRPGTVYFYRSPEGTDTVTVTADTVTIQGVRCVVVRDTNRVDGEIVEDTLDYYAQDRAGNVWYFGESTAEFEDGVVVSTSGTFAAGVDGAKPGIIMPASPRPGVTYRQEVAFGEAEDLGRIESLGETVRVPAGTFRRTLKTFDFTPLEPEVRENKHYAPGVGLVLTVDLVTGEREELVSVRRSP